MAEPAQLRPFGLLDDHVIETQDRSLAPSHEGGDSQPEKGRRTLRTGPRPRYSLPTDRIAWPRQIRLLRSFAVASAGGTAPVSIGEAAALAELSANTASLNSQFLVDAGLLVRSEGGRFSPTEPTREFARAFEWNPSTAGQHLGVALRATWFARALEKRLLIQGSVTLADAVEYLATEAGASPAYQQQIRFLLDYLEEGKIIERSGDSIRLIRGSQLSEQAQAPGQDQDTARDTPPPAAPAAMTPTTPPTQTPKPLGGVQFSIAIDVDIAELSTWSPDRLTAFFSGLAAVIAAKEGKAP
jgi:hypothetical protein